MSSENQLPSREEVKSIARDAMYRRARAIGHDKMKAEFRALLASYGTERVYLLKDDALAAFKLACELI